jgi:transposase
MLAEARDLIDRFQTMIRRRIVAELEPWITDASASLVASFANGTTKDKRAVGTESASHGQTVRPKGQITKLKLVKRQMYGRGKRDLL